MIYPQTIRKMHILAIGKISKFYNFHPKNGGIISEIDLQKCSYYLNLFIFKTSDIFLKCLYKVITFVINRGQSIAHRIPPLFLLKGIVCQS